MIWIGLAVLAAAVGFAVIVFLAAGDEDFLGLDADTRWIDDSD